MAKVFKIVGRILGVSLEWLLICIILFAFIIRTSTVQTYLAKLATDYLSNELETTLRIDKVSIVFIDRVALDGVFVLDKNNDTLASIQTIYAKLDEINLAEKIVKLNTIELSKGKIHVSRAKSNGHYNYWFLTDYFDSGSPSQKAKKPFAVTLKTLELSEMTIQYDDNRKYYLTFGMDYDHLVLQNVHLSASHFRTKNNQLIFTIDHLSAKEKSGFELLEFNGLAAVSGQGIHVDQLHAKTPYSTIYAPKMHLNVPNFDGFQYPEDSITFDAVIAKSLVSLHDISYFATALEGMDQLVEISAKVSKKVKNLQLTDLKLKTGKNTVLSGNFQLPDFRELAKAQFQNHISYARISLDDIRAIKMPVDNSSDGKRYLEFDTYVERLANFEINELYWHGSAAKSILKADKITTDLGTAQLTSGLVFRKNRQNDSYLFQSANDSLSSIKVENFQLDKFLADNSFGKTNGQISISGELFSLYDIQFTELNGKLQQFDFLNYPYSGIQVENGSFTNNVFQAKVTVNDPNVALEYDGVIDLNNNQHLSFSVAVADAQLHKLKFTERDSTRLSTKIEVNIYGNTTNTMYGNVNMVNAFYDNRKKHVALPAIALSIQRGETNDDFSLRSELANVNLKGHINFNTLVSDFTAQFQHLFPSFFTQQPKQKKRVISSKSNFTYAVVTHKIKPFLSIFAPDLNVESGTNLSGKYDGNNQDFSLKLRSKQVSYQDILFKDVTLDQSMDSELIQANYRIETLSYNDSIQLNDFHFQTNGKQNVLYSNLSWNQKGTNNSKINWETHIASKNTISLHLLPSFFSINEQKWEILNQSNIGISEKNIQVEKFKIQHGSQYISADGLLSNNDDDKLNFRINEINLNELGKLIGSDIQMEGQIDGWGFVSNPFSNFLYVGDATIKNLYIDKQEVGDIFVQSQWNRASSSVGFIGDLLYRNNQTFQFDGSYFTERSTDNLDFNLLFDQTDIKFVNAFMDYDVINNVRGLLQGSLKVTGTLEAPLVKGKVELLGGNAKVEMLGVNFGLDGFITANEYGFYIDNMPITDEEGNTGAMIGSIYHEQYSNWNYDLQFNLENTGFIKNSAYFTGANIDKFLVLNTQYKEGDYYYGKGYASGNVNISGYSDNVSITVDLQTKKGTTVNFPMYGVSELNAEESYITFKSIQDSIIQQLPTIDFTGLDLNLNFRVTPDAKLKIIFDEQLGDEITATGSGDISIVMDNLGDMRMDGTYKIKDGLYNFAMGPFKQPFFIEEGGTINWTGDPYNATLDLRTYYEVNASLAEISPDQLQGNNGASNQKVFCYLDLKEALMKPAITFDIKAPKADETGKALLARITSEEDELNRQFFSLLLTKRFQPLKGTTAAGGSAAMDLLTNQINSILSQVSKDYKLNVNLDADNLTGDNTLALGVTKGFMDDRLLFTGSFGIENTSQTTKQTQSTLIGDVSLEYLLNETGTIRVTIFNESNDYSIIHDKNLGLFTQGAGLTYKEDFNHFEDFKFAQFMLDAFRKGNAKKYPIKRTKRQTKLPPIETPKNELILPENKINLN